MRWKFEGALGLRAAALLAAGAAAQDPQPAFRRDDSALDNAGFTETAATDARIPWWVATGGAATIEPASGERSAPSVLTSKGVRLAQPIAASELALRSTTGFVLRASVRGPGRVHLIDGSGARATLAAPRTDGAQFELTLADFEKQLGRRAVPRLTLELSNDDSAEPARWSELRGSSFLPHLEAPELKRRLHDELAWIFELWTTRCIDREGPKSTAFTPYMLDCKTGEKLVTAGDLNQPQPVYELMLDAWAVDPDARWGGELARYLDDFLALAIHPATGLPRRWDCVRDQPLDDAPLEIAKAFHWLLDASEKGPVESRPRALEAAKRIGETVLAKGVLPDGSIAAMYVPSTGAPRTETQSLRRLDVAAELARLSKLVGDARFVDAARRACAEFEFTNIWSGTVDTIDPGFDDSFGHYAARAVTMLESHPADPVFARIVASGWRCYAPLWRDAVRCGGSIAADQVRCWDLLERYARVAPKDSLAELPMLLSAAARAHYKGEQYENGAWGDVTFFEFNPKTGLAVGDLPGAPANLLWGLAILARPTLAGADAASIDRFSAVFLSTLEHYKRPYGYLSTQNERAGANPGAGELRAARGMVEMLGNL